MPTPRSLLITLLAALLVFGAASPSTAQPASGARITPNFKDADITQVIEAVAAATGRNIIVDPRVRAQVTMLSSTPMTPDAFYEAFLALLQVHGFVAAPSGDVLKIIPDANSRTMPGNDLPDRLSATSDEIVTQVVSVTNVSAAQLVAILRPLMPQNAHLAAYPSSNMLILADRANNVNRMLRIIRRIDQASDADIEVVAMQNASAAEVVRTMTALNPAQASAEGGMSPLRVVADDRSNSILLAGDKTQRLRARTLIAYLDTPLSSGGDTRVRYLRYADAEKIAAKLKEQVQGVTAGAPAAGTTTSASADRSTIIWAEPETNALVITAPAKTMNSLMAVIDKLDIRRAQVIVEAIIVEVSADKSAELGVNWLVDGSNADNAVGGFIEPVGGVSIVDLARAATDPTTLTSVPRGTTVGVGRLAAALGITARAEAAGHAHAEQHLVLYRRAGERLIVGVDHRHLQALQIFHFQTVHGIGARAAHADEFDRDIAIRKEPVLEGKFVEVHGERLRNWRKGVSRRR